MRVTVDIIPIIVRSRLSGNETTKNILPRLPLDDVYHVMLSCLGQPAAMVLIWACYGSAIFVMPYIMSCGRKRFVRAAYPIW